VRARSKREEKNQSFGGGTTGKKRGKFGWKESSCSFPWEKSYNPAKRDVTKSGPKSRVGRGKLRKGKRKAIRAFG